MNAPALTARRAGLPRTTQAAEGIPRRRFSVAEVETMAAAGIIRDEERLELIGGDIVPKFRQNNRNEAVRRALLRHLCQTLPIHFDWLPDVVLRLDDDTVCRPDILIFEWALAVQDISARTATLVIEIGDNGRALERKAGLYATSGLRELWTIDAASLSIRTHLEPSRAGYRRVEAWSASSEAVASAFIPGFSLRLADFTLY